MFEIALILGIFANSIFLAGLLHLLTQPVIITLSLVTLFALLVLAKHIFYHVKQEVYTWGRRDSLLVSLVVIASLINLVGALGPELAFDALWYHLTLPKLYLLHQEIYFVPGNLLYYSAMPRLGEMFFTAALSLNGEILAKLMQWGFGILTLITTYLVARRFVNKTYALLAVALLASNLVFAWESTTAYIDLIRTFFESTAFLALLFWMEKSEKKYLLLAGVCIGFALETKLLAIGSVGVFTLLILALCYQKKFSVIKTLQNVILFLIFPLLLISPWFIFSWIHAGSPFYPFFPKVFDVEQGSSLNPILFLKDTWTLFTHADDPLSPLYIMILPALFLIKEKTKNFSLLAIYSLFTFLFWYAAPHIGGARYFLPYLPIWSVFTLVIISHVHDTFLKKMFIATVVFFLLVTSFYRAVANKRYLPVIFGRETQTQFLTDHLNFSYGDFVDSDGWFARNIKTTDRVLLINFHNLYYVNFPYVHQSWQTPQDSFDYIAVQDAPLPPNSAHVRLVYTNPLTHVQVYQVQ